VRPALRYISVALFFAAILGRCVASDERHSRREGIFSRLLQRIGAISYGVYLFHFFFVLSIGRLVKPALGSGLLAFVTMLLAATKLRSDRAPRHG